MHGAINIFVTIYLFSLHVAPCVEGHVRFSGSTIIYGGRVQICSNLTWTTVCSDTWDDQAADVVCSQLGFVPYGKQQCLQVMCSYGILYNTYLWQAFSLVVANYVDPFGGNVGNHLPHLLVAILIGEH